MNKSLVKFKAQREKPQKNLVKEKSDLIKR
jgi:hypothetical protein